MQSISKLQRLLCCACACLCFGAATAADYRVGDRLPEKAAANAASPFRQIDWDALMPKDWNPGAELDKLNLGRLSDADPRAMRALEQMQKLMDDAPIVPQLNGARIRIAGFLVPLDASRGQVSEFLLVPYFGACIHTPPPPANQIIHVIPAKPYKAEGMEPVWVSGVMETTRSDTLMGNAGYRMKAELVAPYRAK